MSLGISSVWRSRQVADGGALLDELAALGCDGIELEYRVRASALAQMAPRLGREARVLSVHAFFPAPDGEGTAGGANSWLFTAPDREEREEAVRQGIATLEAAARVGAGAVVLHLGRVAVGRALVDDFRRLLRAETPDLAAVRTAAGSLLAARRPLAAAHFDAALRSLDRLNGEALRRGLLLGVENRFNPHEMPDLEETDRILREFRGGAVRAWHDTGHALFQERIGMAPQRDWLEAFGPAHAGAHLHDIRGLVDHLAPGTGEADFGAVLRRLPAGALRILELRPETTREEVLAARDLIRGIGESGRE